MGMSVWTNRRASSASEWPSPTVRMPRIPSRKRPPTSRTTARRPTVEAASSARSGPRPSEANRSASQVAAPVGLPWPPSHSVPCEKPSKVVVPIMAASTATVPAPATSGGAPESGRRRRSSRSRQCSGASRAYRPKATPKASALRVHAPRRTAPCRRAARRRRRRPAARACSGRRGSCRPARARRRRRARPPPASAPATPGTAAARGAASAQAPGGPARAARDRAPWAEGREDVADERREHRHGDPQGDVDERRQEVRGPGLHAGEARVDADREDRHAQRAGEDLEHRRDAQDDPLAARAAAAAAATATASADERDDEHDGRPPGEEPARERQVLARRRRRAPARCRQGGRRPRARPPRRVGARRLTA